jgi:hypothetical protein
VLVALWLLLQLDILARATAVLDLRRLGVLEIKVLESPQASLNQDQVRVFLLGQTADATRYVLLTITKASAQRSIVVVRQEQLQMFTIVDHVDVFHDPVRPAPLWVWVH